MYKDFLLFATILLSFNAITHSIEDITVHTEITFFHSGDDAADTADHANDKIPLPGHGEIEEDSNDEDVAYTFYYTLPARYNSQCTFYSADQLATNLFHPEAFIPPPRRIHC
jgi:hypothetical protein